MVRVKMKIVGSVFDRQVDFLTLFCNELACRSAQSESRFVAYHSKPDGWAGRYAEIVRSLRDLHFYNYSNPVPFAIYSRIACGRRQCYRLPVRLVSFVLVGK